MSKLGIDVMARRGSVSSAKRWVENHVGAGMLRRRMPRSRWLCARYEDFVSDPAEQLARICTLLGEPHQPVIDHGTVVLGTHHTVAGNPARFTTGEVRIRVDDEWRAAMPVRSRMLVSLITGPLLRSYGYGFRVKKRV